MVNTYCVTFTQYKVKDYIPNRQTLLRKYYTLAFILLVFNNI